MSGRLYRPAQHPEHLRALGLGSALVAVLISLAVGAGEAALLVILATFGFYAAKAFALVIPRRRLLKQLSVCFIIGGLALIVFWAFGLLPDLAPGGYGLRGSLLAFLLAASASLALGRDRSIEADRFRAILALYPGPGGGEWTAQEMEAATEGEMSAESFERLRNCKTALASPWHYAAMSRVMDFPNELWDRSPEWWEGLLEQRKEGTDVGDSLREWNCYSPDQAARELGISTDDVHRMLGFGELESRTGTDGDLQIRAFSVSEKLLLKDGVAPDETIPWNHDARPGRTGNGRYPNYSRFSSQFGGH